MANIIIALNGKVINDGQDRGDSLEDLAKEWKAWVKETPQTSFEYASGSQIVYRDHRYGSVLTAWVENLSDAVSFEVLEMG